LDGLERRLVADRLLLIRDDPLRDGDEAGAGGEPAAPLHAQRPLERRDCTFLRLRVVVAVVRGHESGARLKVELVNEIALSEMEVDRALVNRRIRTFALDDSEDGPALCLNDRERVGRGAPQPELRGWVFAA